MTVAASPGYFDAHHSTVDELVALVDTVTPPGTYPNASEIVQEVVVYDGDVVRAAAADPVRRRELMGEIATVLLRGSAPKPPAPPPTTTPPTATRHRSKPGS